jgi:hypothetical protein
MTDGSDRWQELDCVLDRVLDGIYDDLDLGRLNEILRADVAACRRYIHYVELHGRLSWGEAVGTAVELPYQREIPAESEREYEDDPSASSLPIIIQNSPDLPAPYSPLGGFLFSYAVAAMTVAIGLLVGWMYEVSVSQQPVAQQSGARPLAIPIAKTPEMQFVGQITGTFDCQWADASTAAVDRAYVPLGRRYALASGLLEISYDSGAKIILQGPCTYQVKSGIGGYLSLGKLTARVEKRGAANGERDNSPANQRSPISNHRSSNPVFTVRTPTAIVSDLGTEFAVEVDKSGASRAHVFLGAVEVRPANSGSAKPLSLLANESARVDLGKDRAIVVREAGRQRAFVREMPKSLPIVLFNSGVGLRKGDLDPHWQVVARSDDPRFKPQAAVVVRAGSSVDLENDPARSQWLSPLGDVVLPEDVTYVFRTTFELTGTSFSRASLRGKFIADDRVVAIRLNGRSLNVPLQHDGEPFRYWTKFHASKGFVKGTNVLEIDVLNANPLTSPGRRRTAKSRVCCRAELEGEIYSTDL